VFLARRDLTLPERRRVLQLSAMAAKAWVPKHRLWRITVPFLAAYAAFVSLAVIAPAPVARASAYCAYVPDRGTLMAIELPEVRFAHRIPVVAGPDADVGPCIGSAQYSRLWCGTFRLYFPLAAGTSRGSAPPAAAAGAQIAAPYLAASGAGSGDEVQGAAVVIDLQQARRIDLLPFRASELKWVKGGSWFAARDLDDLVWLYDVQAGTIAAVVPLPGSVYSIAASPAGNRLYAVYTVSESGTGAQSYLGIIDLDSAALQASLLLPASERPELDTPYRIVGLGASDRVFIARRDQTTLMAVNGDLSAIAEEFVLPGVPVLIAASGEGVYVNDRADDPALALVSLPDLQVRSVRRTGASILALSPSPDGALLVGVLFGSLAVWSADLENEFGRLEVPTNGSPGVVLSGNCPSVNPCGGDCDGDGQVTADELVRAIQVVLEQALPSLCLAADTNGDSRVTVDEVVRAVRFALEGCDGEEGNRR